MKVSRDEGGGVDNEDADLRSSPQRCSASSAKRQNGRNFTVAVDARVLSTSSLVNRRLAVAGLGITMAYDRSVRESLESGDLVRILQRFCEPFPGYYLYYPQRRHASRALRAFVDHLRDRRRADGSRHRSPAKVPRNRKN